MEGKRVCRVTTSSEFGQNCSACSCNSHCFLEEASASALDSSSISASSQQLNGEQATSSSASKLRPIISPHALCRDCVSVCAGMAWHPACRFLQVTMAAPCSSCQEWSLHSTPAAHSTRCVCVGWVLCLSVCATADKAAATVFMWVCFWVLCLSGSSRNNLV